MHWIDQAIVLSARKYGENSAIVRVLAREHGVYAGVIRAAHSKKTRGIFQSGNIINANWSARLSEQLGTFACELLEANAAHIMHDAAKLAALSSACALIESALPERHPYARLYSLFKFFLVQLKEREDWQAAYVHFELSLLAETGFGLDLSRCAATAQTEDLIYVSPKSGRAVSRDAGAPYKEKLLKLPEFLHYDVKADSQEILAGLALTGYFLDNWLLEPHNRKLPAARKLLLARLIQTMKDKKIHATETTSA